MEDDAEAVVGQFDGEALVVLRVAVGEVAEAVVEALDEVPQRVGQHVGRLAVAVERGHHAEEAEGGGFVAHAGEACQLAELLAVEAVGRGVGVGRGVALAQGADVDGDNVAVAHQGFVVGHGGLHLAEASGAELELVHELHQLGTDEVGLVGEGYVVEEVVGLLEDDVLEVVGRVEGVAAFEVEAGVDGADVDDAAEDLIGFVDGENEVVRPAEEEDGDAAVEQGGECFDECEVGVALGGAGDEVAEVGHAQFGVGRGEAVEVAAYVVGRGGAAGGVDSAAVLGHAEEDEVDGVEAREAAVGGVGCYKVAQLGAELAGVVVDHGRVDGGEILFQFHLCVVPIICLHNAVTGEILCGWKDKKTWQKSGKRGKNGGCTDG